MASTPHPRRDRDLLARITLSAGGKAGYKQLIRELGLGGGRERRLLVEQLTRLVARGDLLRVNDDLWAIPSQEPAQNEAHQGPRRTEPSGLWDGMEAAARGGRDRLVSGRLDLHRDGL